jgi:LuxR family transcriptional regulator, maltose regulon positive regulatory protein
MARPLTQTEHRVAQLLASGRTNAEVALELDLSTKTVEWHLSRALRKLGVRSQDELAELLARATGEAIE